MSKNEKMCDCNQGRLPCTCKPAEQHQREPVALPSRRTDEPDGAWSDMGDANAAGWNACLDEIAKLGPLYTHADPVCHHEWNDDGEFLLVCTKCGAQENHEPYGWLQTRGPAINQFTQEWDVVQEWEDQGIEYKAMHENVDPAEVERLHSRLREEQAYVSELAEQNTSLEKERDTLRTQLAERDALLRDAHEELVCRNSPVGKRIDAALAASAEPSAPVERDERAEFEADVNKRYPGTLLALSPSKARPGQYANLYVQSAWDAWQAHAALERNP